MILKIVVLILFFLSEYITAQENSINNLDIFIGKQGLHRYTVNSIPIIVTIRNKNPFSVKFLTPFNKHGVYLNCFHVILRDDSNNSIRLITEQSKILENKELFEYCEIESGKKISFTIMLNNIFQEKLSAGNYNIILSYKNILGDFCMKGEIQSLNILNITVSDSKETDSEQPKYITQEAAIEIAKKENQNNIKYDHTQNIKVSFENEIYTITFPRNKLSPKTFGSSYALKIQIDAKTGKVLTKNLPP